MTTGKRSSTKAKPAISTRFVDNGDGTVTDSSSGLMWAQEDVGRMPHAEAAEACTKLRVGGHSDWRLPTVEELFGIADRTRMNPSIDTAFFPSCRSEWYWSSTLTFSDPSCAWIVHFLNGYAYYYPRYYLAFVRAVRSVARPSQ